MTLPVVLVVDGEAYAFRHALMREAVHGDLLPGEHTRTHARFAEALDADRTLVPPGRAAAELAFHWYSAHDTTWALVSAWQAAQVAKEATAYTEWLRMIDRVLTLWDRVPDAAERLEKRLGWVTAGRMALALLPIATVLLMLVMSMWTIVHGVEWVLAMDVDLWLRVLAGVALSGLVVGACFGIWRTVVWLRDKLKWAK